MKENATYDNINKKKMKHIYTVFLLIGIVLNVFSQDVQTSTGISVSFGEGKLGVPFQFSVQAPELTKQWSLSVFEFNGRIIFEDSGIAWSRNGYFWTPEKDILLFSALNYIVSISFFDTFHRLIKTEVKRFSIPLLMDDTRAPTIIFDGYSTDVSVDLYQNNDIERVLNFIASKANSEFKNFRVHLRGHAAIVNEADKTKEEEIEGLVLLSRQRAEYISQELSKRMVATERISYDALGGQEQLSEDEMQRWKNRRVEILFVSSERDLIESGSLAERTGPSLTTQPAIVIPQDDMPIEGEGRTNINQIVAFILYNVPTLSADYVKQIVMYYIQESNRENINYDVAISQMLLETNFLQFSGSVAREQYNFAGIGTINRNAEGHWFPSELIGIRAHVQHLKGYASRQILAGELVDPRYPIIERLGLIGSAPTVKALSGRWATEPDYGNKILVIIKKLYTFANALLQSTN